MPSLVPNHAHTFEEYLEIEEAATVRHEFYDGEIYAMAGGTPEHAAMAAEITSKLGRQLEGGPCRAYSSDLRLRVLATGLATYPDVTVISGPSERDPASPSHVTNPTLIVEVLSPSTADYDKGKKLEHYKTMPSLQSVLLVDHASERIELHSREGDDWLRREFGGGQVVPLDAISCSIEVDAVYAAARQA